MSDNVVYEIQQMMRDKNIFQQDMSEAMLLIRDMFYKKYFNRLLTTMQTHQTNIQKAPPREVQLMRVLKEFRPEDEHTNIDKMIEMMLLAGSMQKLYNEFHSVKPYSISENEIPKAPNLSTQDTCIHTDGIYDVDKSCIANTNYFN